jgi:hypothetical protein
VRECTACSECGITVFSSLRVGVSFVRTGGLPRRAGGKEAATNALRSNFEGVILRLELGFGASFEGVILRLELGFGANVALSIVRNASSLSTRSVSSADRTGAGRLGRGNRGCSTFGEIYRRSEGVKE